MIFLFLKKDKLQEEPEIVSHKIVKESPPVKKVIESPSKLPKKISKETDEGDLEMALDERKAECDSNELFTKISQ